MGLMDHKATWHYRVRASADNCVAQFAAAFEPTGLSKAVARGRWEVQRTHDGAVATYVGRGGVLAAATVMSEMGSATEARASGSKVTFKVERSDGDTADCSMWLSEANSRLGFTDDAGIFRKHMQSVQKYLRKIDPAVQISKT